MLALFFATAAPKCRVIKKDEGVMCAKRELDMLVTVGEIRREPHHGSLDFLTCPVHLLPFFFFSHRPFNKRIKSVSH